MSDGYAPYLDAHVHFWEPARLPYPWLSSQPSIGAAHVPAQLRVEASDMPAQMVFVQAECDRSRSFDEVLWAEHLADSEPRIAAFVAFVAMDQGAETLAALGRLSGRELVRGIRHPVQDEPDPEFACRPSFMAGVRAVGERGLCFELCLRDRQLPAALTLVRSCPNTRFVLDHAGKPDIRSGRLDPWRGHIEELAACPNVVCKLSGLVTEADPRNWKIEQLRPFASHVLACFEPERVLFGSDWPVLKLAASYGRWLETARALVGHLPPRARRAIFSQTARDTYRLS